MESRLVTNLSSPAVQPGHIPNYIKWSTQAEIHDQCHENKTIIFLPRSRKETQSIVWVYDNFGLYFLPIYQCSRIDYFEAEDTAGCDVSQNDIVPAAVSPNPRWELYR